MSGNFTERTESAEGAKGTEAAKELSTNVLIIGKTGVGKSSFINYLYPGAVRPAGAGRPVTGKGIYRSVMMMGNGLAVNLYDTWGLEASRSREWEKIIADEAKRHDRESIRDWFHTIIYCFSARSTRVERFETEQINALRAKGNRVLAVLTHCDLHNVASAIEKMSEILRDDCGLSGDDIICVSSVNKKTLGGASLLGPFGRERAIERIVSDLWGSIAEKIPPLLLNRGLEMIGEWRESSDAIIDDGINFWNRLSDGAVKSAFGEINDAARRCGEKFSRRAEETLREALGYYSVFAEKYSELTTDCPNRTKGLGLAAADMPRLRGRAGNMSLEDKVIDVIAYIIFPFALPYAAGYKRDELKRKLNRHEKCMREWLETRVDEIRARLSGEEDVTEETADMPEMPEVAAG